MPIPGNKLKPYNTVLLAIRELLIIRARSVDTSRVSPKTADMALSITYQSFSNDGSDWYMRTAEGLGEIATKRI